MAQIIRRRAIAAGRVQGVGFRWRARERALSLGVTGWIRNLPDGTVEASFQGSEQAVAEMERWLRRGPIWARVTSLKVFDEAPADGERGFEIIR